MSGERFPALRFVVLASVSQLRLRSGSYDEAVVAFRSARLRQCLSKLHVLESVAARTLKARTCLRLGNPRAALSALDGAVADAQSERAEIALLSAVAYARLGKDEAANPLFRDAFVYSVSATDLALETDVTFHKALVAIGNGHLSGAREMCYAGLEGVTTFQRYARCRGLVPLEHIVSRLQELLGIINASEGRYRDAIVLARLALVTLNSCKIGDVFQEAFALRNLAIHARDFDIEEDACMLAKRVPALPWTEDVRLVEFATVEALAWCSALRGDAIEALRLFRHAESVASTDPERIVVGVDRALFAREFGHKPLMCEEVDHALKLAASFDWERAAGDCREALLTLAQVAAPITPVRARENLDRYTAIRNAMDGSYAARNEPRARAEEAYTQGLVLRAEGKVAASKERLQCAFETWQTIGYEWRAARAALELAELEAGEVFRLAVRHELFRRPDSVFSARARLVA